MKKHVFLLVGLLVSLTSFGQQALNWTGIRGSVLEKTIPLSSSWTGTASVKAYTEPGGRLISTLLQPTVTRQDTTLFVSFPNPDGLSNNTYVTISTGSVLRYAGYVTLGYTIPPIVTGSGSLTPTNGIILPSMVQGLGTLLAAKLDVLVQGMRDQTQDNQIAGKLDGAAYNQDKTTILQGLAAKLNANDTTLLARKAALASKLNVNDTTLLARKSALGAKLNVTDTIPLVRKSTYQVDKTGNDNALNIRVVHKATIAALQATSGSDAGAVNVRDPLRGGNFTWYAMGYTVDNGCVFAASGGGFWVRQFQGNIQAAWYGAKGDGSTDDYDAIMSAINGAVAQRYIAGIGQLGANVDLGLGSFFIGNGKRIVLPDRVRLIGRGRRLTEIKISAGFKVSAADSVVVELSNKLQTAGKKNIFHTALEHLSLNLNGASGVIGVYSEEINEGSGLFNVAVTNIQYKGCQVYAPVPSTGFGPQNFALEKLEFIFNNSETALSTGIQLDLNGATVQNISDISFVGKNVTATGLDVSGASGFTVQKIHIENLAKGMYFGQRTQCFAFNVIGVDAQQIVTTSVYFRGTTDSYAYTLTGIRATSGGITIQDFRNQPSGKTNITGPVPLYAVGGESYTSALSRTVVCSNSSFSRQLYKSGAGTPTTSDIGPSGFQLWKNTTDGSIKWYANDGGTIKAGAAFN